MAQSAHVTGEVQYREGDGPLLTIRKGPVEVETTEQDAILSWTEIDSLDQNTGKEVRSTTSLPKVDYQRYLDEGAIRLDG